MLALLLPLDEEVHRDPSAECTAGVAASVAVLRHSSFILLLEWSLRQRVKFGQILWRFSPPHTRPLIKPRTPPRGVSAPGPRAGYASSRTAPTAVGAEPADSTAVDCGPT
eukprot:SAG31_NODE_14327_length_813_cov_1.470588_1_plen_110_part_00